MAKSGRGGFNDPCSKGIDITYRTAHNRVTKLWGKAEQYGCVRCGSDAHEWAYDGTDPGDKVYLFRGRHPMRYSPYPEFYKPMCRPCHRLIDAYPNGLCSNGHEMTEDNIVLIRTRPGRRRCRKCIQATDRRTYLKRKARLSLS